MHHSEVWPLSHLQGPELNVESVADARDEARQCLLGSEADLADPPGSGR